MILYVWEWPSEGEHWVSGKLVLVKIVALGH